MNIYYLLTNMNRNLKKEPTKTEVEVEEKTDPENEIEQKPKIIKPLKNQHDEWFDSAKTFWSKNKDECCLIRSIDEVYNRYVKYYNENAEKNDYIHMPMNKYIFRTYIRKHGYNNGNVEKFGPDKYIKLSNINETGSNYIGLD